jgi:hypothetical protein
VSCRCCAQCICRSPRLLQASPGLLVHYSMSGAGRSVHLLRARLIDKNSKCLAGTSMKLTTKILRAVLLASHMYDWGCAGRKGTSMSCQDEYEHHLVWQLVSATVASAKGRTGQDITAGLGTAMVRKMRGGTWKRRSRRAGSSSVSRRLAM